MAKATNPRKRRKLKHPTGLQGSVASVVESDKSNKVKMFKGQSVLHFGSGCKMPQAKLSNFYGSKVEIEGGMYPSLEHYYQSLKVKPEHRKAFRCGGRFAGWRAMALLFKKADVERKTAYWKRKNMIGVIAKMVIKRASKLGVVLEDKHVTFKDFAAAEALWLPLLKAKMAQHPDIAAAVLATDGQYLLEFSRSAQRHADSTVWAGLISEGKLFGRNWMGRLWMVARAHALQSKEEEKQGEGFECAGAAG